MRALLVPALAAWSLAAASCALLNKEEPPQENTVLSSRAGETAIQVTESDRKGNQVVRVKTTYRGEEANVVLNIDQQNYEIEIPLSVQQVLPQTAAGAAPGAPGGAQGNFQDLLIAQYMEKGQEAMLNGDYNGALRQVNLILLVQPDNVKAHEMKGSIYYAMGNYSLANEEWEQVLAADPSNEEVRQFQEFMKSRGSAKPPPLPGAPTPPAAGTAPNAGASK
ncbi:MAG: hypothetical protein HY342_05000 [Candidatus Lambdaproteobacteria bacterium]|nr:hypothetical protein [Candidatus Lambdaproteobacteria bacterium]